MARKSEQIYFENQAKANDLTQWSVEETQLGVDLEHAFHDKNNPARIAELVRQGAPVNYRLDYGLEINLEADFVYEFFLLLQGDKGKDKLLENIKLLMPKSDPKDLADYLSTSKEIFDHLNLSTANKKQVPINPAYKEILKQYAVNGRANPDHQNGSLIIAAGLRDPALVLEIITFSKATSENSNGASVLFKGFFEDTAAVWSAILLDHEVLKVLVEKGSDVDNLGISQSSVLHWIILAVRVKPIPERIAIAKLMIDNLEGHGINFRHENKLGLSIIDYLDDNATQVNQPLNDFFEYVAEKYLNQSAINLS